MADSYVRSGPDQKSRWLSRLLRPFRGRGEFRRQRERANSHRVAQLLGHAARISGRRAGHELAGPVELSARATRYRQGQMSSAMARARVLEAAMWKSVAKILLYAAAVIGVSVPLGAVAFVCLALIGF